MASLAQLRAAHRALGGGGPGRRTTTQQINHAYAVLVMARFQGFCRDLHTEAADVLARTAQPAALASVVRSSLTAHRRLDRANPTPTNIAADFGRLGMAFWPAVHSQDARNTGRRDKLESLGSWRNAISHHDFTGKQLGGRPLNLDMVESWYSACHCLAGSFDRVVGEHLFVLTGRRPW